jgi:serine protease AprX
MTGTAVAATLLLASAIGLGGAPSEHRARLSDDLTRRALGRSAARERVIIPGAPEQVAAVAKRHGLTVVKWLREGVVVRANGRELSRLVQDAAIEHLSGDPLVRVSMAISNRSTAADQARAGTSGLLGIGSISGVTGQGVGVAVVDSGIAAHSALARKVIANVSFVTGDPSADDKYGHGTHVAGIIAGAAGAASQVTDAYTGGIAPGVQLVNVRVLGDNGAGYTSDVIAGIDWVIENRARYNIRVMNLSLGHPVMEPAAFDPLTRAVGRAVAAGIVAVVAAGNDGRTSAGVPIMGGINSPGNSPYAITVGAVITQGTVARSDDVVAPYSSRGPTKYDMTAKPDLVAPGNRIVSLEAVTGYLGKTYPWLHRAGTGSNAYMQLSGTSMAAPVVTGAVALLLQGSPSMGTAHVKLALQAGATYMPDGGLMGGGAGSLNVMASRRIATNGLASNLLNTVVGGVTSTSSGAAFWDSGTLADRVYQGSGLRLLSSLILSGIWSNPSLLRFGDLNLVGLLNPLRLVPANHLIWGREVMTWSNDDDQIIWGTDDQIIWGTTMYDDNGDQIIWGTSGDDQIIWGTNDVLTADAP